MRKKTTNDVNFATSTMIENAMESILNDFCERTRREMPELKNASDDELREMLMEALSHSDVIERMQGHALRYYDPNVQEQMDKLESGKPLIVVQSKKKLLKNLGEMDPRTITDYLKYSRLTADNQTMPEKIFAEYLLEHVEILYYFFERDEMNDLLSLWDYYRSGQTILEGEFLMAITKAICLGLIRLTGKRKLKLELCAEFEKIINMINSEQINSIYAYKSDNIRLIGSLLMAYIAMPFDMFYEVYFKYTKQAMDKLEFETFIYWTGTMNGELTTFHNSESGENYLGLPGLLEYLGDLEIRGMSNFFQTEPRHLSKTELKKWSQGFNFAIPEWEQFIQKLEINAPVPDQVIFDKYIEVASGKTMTELILNDLEAYEMYSEFDEKEMDLWEMELDIWLSYAELCLVTPICGLNGYSREQYAEKAQVSYDYIPLFDVSLLKRRITKYTHIYEFPRDIQLEILRALRKGPDTYVNTIRRLSRKYSSNIALSMELAIILGEKVMERSSEFENMADMQNVVYYPWSTEEPVWPKPDTYVRDSKKIGRNDMCPCGSGRKYKHCCGK